MRYFALSLLFICLSLNAVADEGTVLTNKDVDAHKASGRTITVITPDSLRKSQEAQESESEAAPAGEEDWETLDRQKDEARAAIDKLEDDWNAKEADERAKEEEGFYTQDPNNPNKRIWVDPADEDFYQQLKDRRKARKDALSAAQRDLEDGVAPTEDAAAEEPDDDMVEFINPRTRDIELVSKTDPRYKRYLREAQYGHSPLVPNPDDEDDGATSSP